MNEVPESGDLDATEKTKSASDGCCLSHLPICYPPGPEIVAHYKAQMTIGSWKIEGDLCPDNKTLLHCRHGHSWSDDDPLSMGWIRCTHPYIYYLQWTDNSRRNGKSMQNCICLNCINIFNSIAFLVLYRQTTGDCHCKLDYDGQADLLMNLDGKHLIHYGLLYHYLHLMVEGRNPLAAFTRYAKNPLPSC